MLESMKVKALRSIPLCFSYTGTCITKQKTIFVSSPFAKMIANTQNDMQNYSISGPFSSPSFHIMWLNVKQTSNVLRKIMTMWS